MSPSKSQLLREIDAVEMLASLHAYPGAKWRLSNVERELRALLCTATASAELGMPTSDNLWKHFLRLRAAVEAASPEQVASSVEDLKFQLAALEQRGGHDPLAVH
jgi:hypothetical protein